MIFDEHGFITPYEIVEISLKEFEEIFVNSREERHYRGDLFRNYLEYLEAIKNIIGQEFFQLVNGSFTTLKLKPKDIDFVTFVDYRVLRNCEDAVNALTESGKERFGLDGFFAPHSKPGHSYFMHAQLIFEYWRNLFSFTRSDDKGHFLPKGVIKMTFPQ